VTAFLDLVTQIREILWGSTPVAGGNIFQGRAFALQEGISQGVFIRPVRSVGSSPFMGDGRNDWDTDIEITCVARATADVDGQGAVDWLVNAVFERLKAATPPDSANGWAVLPQITWDTVETDQTVGSASIHVRIQHRTGDADLTTAA
jgi:hypothetical protein